MKLNTLGLDCKITNEVYGNINHITLALKNDSLSEEIDIKFIMTAEGIEHTMEQMISALFDYDEDMAHKICEEYGNMKNLKEEIQELKDKLHQTRLMLASHSDEFN